jgi:KaiC/GvpD/RAD55 family RecA-like ATPase
LVKAVFDLKQNLYTEQQAIELLTKACTNAQKQLDNSDFKNIRGIYKNYVPKYPPRVPDPKNAPKTYTSMTPEERRQRLAESNAFLDRARTHSTTFIHPVFDPYYRLVPGLTLIGARTGEGKSTVASNLVHRFVKDNPLKSVLYISNEETSADVLNRIACIDCKIPFKNFRERSLEAELVKRVTERAEALTTGIEVVEKPEFDMTALEDVQGVLNAAVTMENVGLIVIDYLQTIHKSTSQPTLEEIRVSKEMGHFLREYGKQATFPLVAFAQLKPRSEAAEFSARIHNDRTMLHHAVAGIEVKPDFKTLRTEFVMQKLRFGDSQGKSVFLKFAFGRFEPLSDEQLKELGSGKAESAKSFASFEKAMNELRENDDPAERTTQTTPDPPQALTTHLKTAPVRESD